MEKKNSNFLAKTLVFIIVLALTCLLFFGLFEEKKTDLQLVSFGFFIFAELVIYLSALLPTIFNQKFEKNKADIISAGVLYGLASLLINCIFISYITTMRLLLVLNISLILIYLLIFTIVIIQKRR